MIKSQKKKVHRPTYKYNTRVGGTDYDIPVFGYKSAFIILFATFIPLLIVPSLCDFLHMDHRILTVLVTGVVSGFSVAYTQFFIEREIGINRQFWILAALVSCVAGGLVFLLIYAGILM